MLEIKMSRQFRRDAKLARKRGLNINKLKAVIGMLADGVPLDARYREHHLTGEYSGFLECHIEPDWLLIYRIEHETLSLLLFRTGTHADLF